MLVETPFLERVINDISLSLSLSQIIYIRYLYIIKKNILIFIFITKGRHLFSERSIIMVGHNTELIVRKFGIIIIMIMREYYH